MEELLKIIAVKAGSWGLKQFEKRMRQREIEGMTTEEILDAMQTISAARELLPYLARRIKPEVKP